MSLEVRPAREDEAQALHALLHEHALGAFGEPELDVDEVRSWFRLPSLSIQVAERDGRIVGDLDVDSEESGHFGVDARTPDADVAPVLVAAAESYARTNAEHPILRGFVQGGEPSLRAAYEAAAWRPIRHSFQMRIDLDDELPEPVWPEGVRVRNVREGEEERVYEANMDSFADHWDFRPRPFEEWCAFAVESHRFDPSFWWLVEQGDELAAIALNSWHSSGDPTFGWVHVLGVRPAWRQRGIATALLRHSFRDFRARGATRVGLGVDGENTTGAVRLYEKVGMHVARRTDIYEKTL